MAMSSKIGLSSSSSSSSSSSFFFLLMVASGLLTICSAASAFDLNTAIRGLYYSKASYCDKNSLMNYTCGTSCSTYPLSDPQVIESAYDTQTVVGFDKNTSQIVIAFRGSSNLENWIADLDFILTNYSGCSGCKVHQGFLDAYRDMNSQIHSHVAKLMGVYGNKPLFITGHSLGAALSWWCALDMIIDFSYQVDILYNFGSPRIGDPTFVKWAANQLEKVSINQSTRVTHAADPVPHLPPMAFGYLHIPTEVWNTNNGTTVKTCNDSASGEDKHCSDSLLLPVNVEDHLHYLGHRTEC